MEVVGTRSQAQQVDGTTADLYRVGPARLLQDHCTSLYSQTQLRSRTPLKGDQQPPPVWQMSGATDLHQVPSAWPSRDVSSVRTPLDTSAFGDTAPYFARSRTLLDEEQQTTSLV